MKADSVSQLVLVKVAIIVMVELNHPRGSCVLQGISAQRDLPHQSLVPLGHIHQALDYQIDYRVLIVLLEVFVINQVVSL